MSNPSLHKGFEKIQVSCRCQNLQGLCEQYASDYSESKFKSDHFSVYMSIMFSYNETTAHLA